MSFTHLQPGCGSAFGTSLTRRRRCGGIIAALLGAACRLLQCKNILTCNILSSCSNAQLLHLIEESRRKGELQFTLTDVQRHTLARLKRVSEVLETSLMQLDDMLAVFNEY